MEIKIDLSEKEALELHEDMIKTFEYVGVDSDMAYAAFWHIINNLKENGIEIEGFEYAGIE